ncbi:hypothetical protein ACQP0C_06270 [Nocardia sp. CA-129566]|uniref:hypothetical protein n=1 Tax=Nocardia sp. CA-129566 TaxID=3239976 RepID=UPI003D981155
MRYRAGLAGEATLRVTVEFSDAGSRSLGIEWSPVASGAHKKLEYARIFLVPLGSEGRRVYLGIVDGRASTSVRLPEALADGEYAMEVDAYGSASWGDGRLDARGRSATFVVGAGGLPCGTGG